MCGIAGIMPLSSGAKPALLVELEAMVMALRHRGPDEFGLYRDQHLGLGHARLSIIDLNGGRQPMSDGSGTTGWSSTARFSTTSSCAPSSWPRAIPSAPAVTPRSSSSPLPLGASRPSSDSTVSLPWRCGSAANDV